MKKPNFLVGILIVILVFTSCSSNNDEDCIKYIITIETECNNEDTRKTYILAEIEYQRLLRVSKEPCESIEFEDINGNTRSGIPRVLRGVSCDA